MLVRELLTDACYLSLNDENFQPAISPGTLTSALRQFNLMLDEYRDSIPYTFQYYFDDVDDLQETTFVMVDDVAFIINTVVVPLTPVNLIRWREFSTVENLVGFPQIYFFDESVQTIRVYPAPSMPAYQFLVNGRRALGPLALDDDLPDNMPDYMKNVLMYEMAFRLCGKNGVPWSPEKDAVRQRLQQQLKNKEVIDLEPRMNIVFPRSGNSIPGFPYYYYLSGGGR